MSNTSRGKGTKGSKFWMGTVTDFSELKNEANELLGQKVIWYSPLCKDDYIEYQIKQCRDLIAMSPSEIQDAFSFWPSRQPQWDGIAVNESKEYRTLYIIEAKAHIKELNSKCQASEKSKKLIIASMKEVHDKHYPNTDFNDWMSRYYQFANRLTFYHKMQDMILDKKIAAFDDVKLVFLNIANDFTYIPTSLHDWEECIETVLLKMTGVSKAPKGVLTLYVDVNKYREFFEKNNDGSWKLKHFVDNSF